MSTRRPELGLTQHPLPPLAPPWALRLGVRLRSLLHRAIDKLVPADVLVLERVVSVAVAHAIGAVARLRIADLLAGRPATAAELAVETGVDADALHRTLRLLASQGIFALRDDGRFEPNRRSR